jgi:hypothetical protein
VKFEKRTLQLPMDKRRCHYVKAKVEVHRYPNSRMPITWWLYPPAIGIRHEKADNLKIIQVDSFKSP